MVSYNVLTESFYIHYKTHFFSKASIIWILLAIIMTVCPLIVTYRTVGLWEKEISFREQPDIRYTDELYLVLQTSNGLLYWSSNHKVANLAVNNLRQPLIKWHEADENLDGKKDILQLSITVPLMPTEKVLSTFIVLGFDYKLHKMCEVEIGSGVAVDYSSGAPLSSLVVMGDLAVQQRSPIACRRQATESTSILHHEGQDEGKPPSFWSPSSIIKRYWRKNVTTRLSNKYIVPQHGPADAFSADIAIRYVEQEVQYVPSFWHTLKMAWIEYLSVFVVFWYLANTARRWIYTNHIVPTLEYVNHRQKQKFQ